MPAPFWTAANDLELRFSEECHLIDVLRRKQHQVTQRHARLWTQGRSQADAFVSGLISSKEPILFAFLDQSGNPVPTHQCLQLVNDDFLQRAQGTGKGDSELNSLITQQVAQIRKDVLREVDGLQDDQFSIAEVQAALIKLSAGSTAVGLKSLQIPRSGPIVSDSLGFGQCNRCTGRATRILVSGNMPHQKAWTWPAS